jgi:hypothetical protein
MAEVMTNLAESSKEDYGSKRDYDDDDILCLKD